MNDTLLYGNVTQKVNGSPKAIDLNRTMNLVESKAKAEDIEDTEELKNAFLISCSSKSFKLIAHNAEEKKRMD